MSLIFAVCGETADVKITTEFSILSRSEHDESCNCNAAAWDLKVFKEGLTSFNLLQRQGKNKKK